MTGSHRQPFTTVPAAPVSFATVFELEEIATFVEQDALRFYTWQGQALPCSFIKVTTGLPSIQALRARLHAGHIPPGCAGCNELRTSVPPLEHIRCKEAVHEF
ncbi:MAG: hypothetical protein E6Q78_00555 [Rhodoferax sp.]|nr:MAG: hypothetical protein E6Q78_00555 [Rhodoferax sp.]